MLEYRPVGRTIEPEDGGPVPRDLGCRAIRYVCIGHPDSASSVSSKVLCTFCYPRMEPLERMSRLRQFFKSRLSADVCRCILGIKMGMDEDIIEHWRSEGREEGRAEGMEKGRAEGRAEGMEKGRAEGRAEGMEKGRAEARSRMASYQADLVSTFMRSRKWSVDKAMDELKVSEDMREDVIRILRSTAA